MTTIYKLIIIDKAAREKFNIGFFSCRKNAETAAEKYLSKVKGFNERRCEYTITEKRLAESCGDTIPTDIFIIYGWNENSRGDETDIMESDCFVSEMYAQRELNELRAGHSRENWCIDKYTIDECYWKDGFITIK